MEKTMKRMMSAMGALGLIMLLSACASVPMATDSEDTAAKQATPPAGKALVYVYRNETLGAAIKMPVTLDGRLAGETASKTYFMFTVDSGTHEIGSIGETNQKLNLKCEAGKTYYVWQEMKMGMWAPNSLLNLVDAATGREALKECKLIKANF